MQAVRAPWFWPWAALAAFSLVLHLAGLADRPFHPDEAIHAKLSLELARHGRYDYDPAYHGPLLYYLAAAFFLVLGDGDFVARLPAACVGVAFLYLAWRLKRPLGMKAAWFTGLLFTISPLCLYYGRFLAMDLLVMFAASACLLCLYELSRTGRFGLWPCAGFWAALAFAAKENAFVTVFLVLVTWLLVAVACRWPLRPTALLAASARHRLGIASALSVFAVVVLMLYTVFLRQGEDWRFAIDAVRYWTGQHAAERIGGPWWYHLFRIAIYEFLVVGAALAWMARRRQVRPFEMGLACFGLASLVMYAYLGEKTPWLAVHQLWAFFPLAGAQLARTFGRRGRWWSRTLAAAGLSLTMVVGYNAVYRHGSEYPNGERVEALHYATTVDGFAAVVGMADAFGPTADRYAAVSGVATWPLAWYWRDRPVHFAGWLAGTAPVLVVADTADRAAVEERAGGGLAWREVPVRMWWHAHRRTPTAAELLRYALWREPWVEPVLRSVVVGVRNAGDPAPARDRRP